MTGKTFRALIVSEEPENKFVREIKERSTDQLPDGEVLVKVEYSSLNYKDVLSAIGNRGVTRNYPHTPGIDAVGVVEESKVEDFKPGEPVIVTSYDLGMNTPGGFGQYIRVPASWVVRRPEGLTARESMIYGTAGFTAALSIYMLMDRGVTPAAGPVLVSGATGGVGGVAVSILAKDGFEVTAVNGLIDEKDYLLDIGAKDVISIEEATDASGKPMLKTLWGASVDTVGGDVLTTTIKSMRYGGVVTCCGNRASHELPLNVYPFILRAVTLIGIDSQNCPAPLRQKIWDKLASDWKLERLETITTEVTLDQLNDRIEQVRESKHRGRTVVKMTE